MPRITSTLALLTASAFGALNIPCPPGSRPSRRAVLEASSAMLLESGLAAVLVSQFPSAAVAASFDPDRYGDKELKIATVNRIKQAIQNECAGDLSLLPAMLQLSLSDAFSYQTATRTGGIDGSILLELDRESSQGLQAAAAKLQQIHTALKRQTQISKADVVAFAGAAAIEAVGGPRVVVQLGREDAKQPEPERTRQGFSWNAPTLDGLQRMLRASGFGARELVALVGAVESLKLAAVTVPPDLSAEDVDEDDEDGDTTLAEMGLESAAYRQNKDSAQRTDRNFYGKNKLSVDVRGVKLGTGTFDSSYFVGLLDKKRALPLSALESAILADKELRSYVETYAKSKQKFREDVRSAYGKLQAVGGDYNGAAMMLDDSN